MAGVHGAALFVVFDQHITHLFSTRVVDSVFAAAGAKGSSGEMERPSVVLNRVSIGCRTVQIACGPIAVDCTGMFRSLLFRNFSGDVSEPPPGGVMPALTCVIDLVFTTPAAQTASALADSRSRSRECASAECCCSPQPR